MYGIFPRTGKYHKSRAEVPVSWNLRCQSCTQSPRVAGTWRCRPVSMPCDSTIGHVSGHSTVHSDSIELCAVLKLEITNKGKLFPLHSAFHLLPCFPARREPCTSHPATPSPAFTSVHIHLLSLRQRHRPRGHDPSVVQLHLHL